jgi:osmoprotectant transport system ATP-binding protein
MIEFRQVSKVYPDGTTAVSDLSLQVGRGEIVVLVGPSGCGKTTSMRMVNRLVQPTSGQVLVDGEDVAGVDPVQLRRRIGYVIQHIGLFPHRTVLANVSTVPELLGWDPARTRERARELLRLVGLDPDQHGPRYPHELSGGQRQRVGVARALAVDPPVLLMDEPFSAVDPIVRGQLQEEFLRLQRAVGTTVLFVTHDIEEAVRLGDRVAVLAQGGHLQQYDTPATILGAPATPFVADFVGADRGLKRLAVTAVIARDLEQPPVVQAEDSWAAAQAALHAAGSRWAVVLDRDGQLVGWVGDGGGRPAGPVSRRTRAMAASVHLGDSLKHAFGEMLQHDAGWIAVLSPDDDRYLGVLTPGTLHAALRRSIEADARDVAPDRVELDTVHA